jgi:polyketide synthase PksJ
MTRRQATSYERFQWLRYRRNPDDPGLTISYVYELSGAVDLDWLDAALRETVTTAFPRLLDHFGEVCDRLEAGTRSAPRSVLRRYERADALLSAPGLDPAGHELYRFSYWPGSPNSLLLRLDFSHLVFDGGCYAPFLMALSACWRGEPSPTPRAVPPQRKPDPAASESYWRAALHGRRLHQPLPFCSPTPHRGGRPLSVKETLTGKRADEVHRFLRHHEVSPLQLVVGITGALVHAYDANERSVLVAHTVDTREYGAPHGCHTNLLPLWLDLLAEVSALDLVDQVRTQREELRVHQHFPTLDLLALAASDAGRPPERGPLLNLVVNHSAAMLPTALPDLPGVEVTWRCKPNTASSSDVAVNFSFDEAGIHFSFDSSTHLMTPEALSALATNFLAFARFAVTRPRRPLSDCDLSRALSPVAEGPARTEPKPRSLGGMLTDAARHNADRVAVVDDHRSFFYRDLLDAADALGRTVAPDAGPVGVFLERSAAIPVAYLAALVLGRTFVPLDPRLPDTRLTYQANTADVRVILADATTRDRAAHLFPHARVHDVAALPHQVGPTLVPALANPDRTAYVLFTSGSTGNPKGVAVSEGSLVNFLLSAREDPGMRPEDRIPALTPVSFDISLLEFLLPLLCGGSVEVLADETRLSGTLLAERLADDRITVIQATPSTWRILQAAGWRAGRPMALLCGGEDLDPDLAEYLLAQGAAVYTMYGPTEATIWSSWHRVTDARHVHLGTPAHNTRYYVLDDSGRAVAPGMRGELVIAGDCVGKGYLNAPSTPFRALPDGSPAYWTGDLVRYEGHGRVTYISRRDDQRKVNGYRIEPGEVAAAVRAFAPSATVFVVVSDEPEPHLRCFAWLPADEDFDAEAAREWCRARLPYYLVPESVHQLREIPLTPNGKADLKKLAEAPLTALDLHSTSTGRAAETAPNVPAADSILAELRQLVANELRVPAPDVDQPLGYQGVNSLGYNTLAVRIAERYGVTVHAHDFYRWNTLRNVAKAVERLTSDRPAVTTPRPAAPSNTDDDRLAVVGLSAVLPSGPDPQAFWEALIAGTDSVRPASAERGLPGEIAGFLPSVKRFDARFFSISPLEASWMDPRQRLLLQSTWHALEDAGYAPSELRGSRTGCYVAATGNDYALLQARANAKQTPHSLVGHSASLLANRISSWFDWHGPSTTLDTACSGSLVALVKACRDLRAGVCDTAVVGGVNLIIDQQVNDGLHAARFLSPKHRCATFDARADGYIRGEGYGTLVVKRLADALAAEEHILAVVESVAENHGGRANSLTAPNPNAQYRLLLDAYTPELAARTHYVETHGSGTALGDAIEIDALTAAWVDLVPDPSPGPVWLGAVKTNTGHLEAAAGIASLVKVTKAFEHRTLPGNLHFTGLNPGITLAGTPFEVLEKTVSWDTIGSEPLVAGISSFGFGGSNAHVVLSSPPPRPTWRGSPAGAYLVPLSARSPRALHALTAALLDHLEQVRPLSDDALPDLSYTLCRSREHFQHRHAWVVSSIPELLDALRAPGEPIRAPAASLTGTPTPSPKSAHRAYLSGHPVDWRELFAGQRPWRLRLPAYPFDEAEYWFTDDGGRT